jgi:hypothetical protein
MKWWQSCYRVWWMWRMWLIGSHATGVGNVVDWQSCYRVWWIWLIGSRATWCGECEECGWLAVVLQVWWMWRMWLIGSRATGCGECCWLAVVLKGVVNVKNVVDCQSCYRVWWMWRMWLIWRNKSGVVSSGFRSNRCQGWGVWLLKK